MKEAERVKKLEVQLADLKKRWPKHSVPAGLMMQLDELEEELEVARQALARAEEKRIGQDWLGSGREQVSG